MVNGTDFSPLLFGLKQSNRDFTKLSDWGKNIFNNTFPISLICYMSTIGFDPIYLCCPDNYGIIQNNITAQSLFGLNSTDQNLFFAFESIYSPYEHLMGETLPRIDLVTQSKISETQLNFLRPLEIKLTAIPDNATAQETEVLYAPEMVIRPDSIVYLALSFLSDSNILDIFNRMTKISLSPAEWNTASIVNLKLSTILDELSLLLASLQEEHPFLIQSIWKTRGKSLVLENHCLDCFVWSNKAFLQLIIEQSRKRATDNISRIQRSAIWIYTLLQQYINVGKFNHSKIIKDINFGSQTDKAFALNGKLTYPYLKSPHLLEPRILRTDLKHIILNDGWKNLSPERRFDAAILSNLDVFED